MSEEPNAPITTEMPCPECNKNAELKVLKVDIPGEVASLISSLQCKNCQYKDNSIHDGDIGNGTGVFISCAFQNNDDIKRFVRLAEGSQVKVEKNGSKFEFTVTVSGVYVVESIIQDIISKYSVHSSVEETNKEGEKVMTKERAAKRLVILKDIIENPQFEMSISDNTGTSRIAPIGKMLRDIESDDMNLYNDERVRHAPFRVINRSG